MEKISSKIFIENSYPGVIVGAITSGDSVVLIDAPLRPEDGRSWLGSLLGLKGGSDRFLVYLDAHIDRTLGGRVMDSTAIAHQIVYDTFEQRSSVFKAQMPESGTDWETITGLSGIRWMSPNMAFTTRMSLKLKDTEIVLEHHPGPEKGSIWVVVPDEEVVFIGDLVTVSQPPFLAYSNLGAWDTALDVLSSKPYKDYTKISSRDGVISDKDVRNMRKFLSGVHKQLDRMTRRQVAPNNLEKMIDKLLGMFEFAPRYRSHYHQRLYHGLQQCYTKQYYNPKHNRAKKDEQ